MRALRFILGLILILSLAPSHVCAAKKIKKARKQDPNNPIVKQLKLYREDPSFYQKFVMKTDRTLEEIYINKWLMHDQQKNYYQTSLRHEVLNGAPPNATQSQDMNDRYDLANRTLRTRVESIVYEFTKSTQAADTLKSYQKKYANVQKTIQAMGTVTLKSEATSAKDVPTEVILAYDIFSDSGRLECRRGVFSAGLYHPAFMNSLPRSQVFFDNLSLRMSTQLDPILTNAYLNYRLNSFLVETGVTKRLSKKVETQFSTSQPFNNTALPSYQMKFLFNF